MALEFALRSRLNLERPARQRTFRLRLPKLALPIAAYWLAMAGGTYVLLGVLADKPTTATAKKQGRPRRAVAPLAPPQAASLADATTTDSAPSDTPAKAALASSPMLNPAPTSASFTSAPLPITPPTHDVRPLGTATSPVVPEPATARSTALNTEVVDSEPSRSEPDEPVVPTPARKDDAPAVSLPSCESAAASANQSIDLRGGGRRAPDLTRDAFASLLENGTYLAACSIPDRIALEICAAVQDGKVIGVSVTTEPRNATISACVRRAVAALRFPNSARVDVTRTRFEATGR